MTIPIGRFLREFSQIKTPPLPPLAVPEGVASHQTEAQVIAAIEDAHCAGFRAAAVEADRAVARREAELVAAHAAEMAAARSAWTEKEGESLARMIETRLGALEKRVAACAAEVLRPLLPQAIALRTVADLKSAVGTLLTGSDPAPITVSGPPDLLEPMKRALGSRAGVSFEVADGAEITVVSGETTIRSALKAWADRLALELATPA